MHRSMLYLLREKQITKGTKMELSIVIIMVVVVLSLLVYIGITSHKEYDAERKVLMPRAIDKLSTSDTREIITKLLKDKHNDSLKDIIIAE